MAAASNALTSIGPQLVPDAQHEPFVDRILDRAFALVYQRTGRFNGPPLDNAEEEKMAQAVSAVILVQNFNRVSPVNLSSLLEIAASRGIQAPRPR